MPHFQTLPIASLRKQATLQAVDLERLDGLRQGDISTLPVTWPQELRSHEITYTKLAGTGYVCLQNTCMLSWLQVAQNSAHEHPNAQQTY